MVTREKPNLLVLIGPTAVGKTKLSLHLAETYGCEILSGDSMQVYRGMDIGTAKASVEERVRIPHHLIDIRNPDEPFSASEFQRVAGDAIAALHKKGVLPFVVGGTGLYIESLCYGFEFAESGSDETFREEQRRFLAVHGEQALHDRLREVDPAAAERIHPNDDRRVIRALEIAFVTGKPMSAHLAEQRKESPYRLCILGLTMDRTLLYKRIEERIDSMIADGLVHEVRGLLDRGYGPGLVSMQGLGYKEIAGHLLGAYDLPVAVELLKRNTRRFAKRQLTWFRRMKDIHWFDVTNGAHSDALFPQIRAIMGQTLFLDGKLPSQP